MPKTYEQLLLDQRVLPKTVDLGSGILGADGDGEDESIVVDDASSCTSGLTEGPEVANDSARLDMDEEQEQNIELFHNFQQVTVGKGTTIDDRPHLLNIFHFIR